MAPLTLISGPGGCTLIPAWAGKEHMNRFKKEVTPPEIDCGLMFGTAAVSWLIAMMPPFG